MAVRRMAEAVSKGAGRKVLGMKLREVVVEKTAAPSHGQCGQSSSASRPPVCASIGVYACMWVCVLVGVCV